jgi:CHAT domain-containing protein
LVEKYSIARIPAFNLIKPDFTRINNLQVLGMGASEFSQAQLESLPAVRVELNKITQDLRSGKKIY